MSVVKDKMSLTTNKRKANKVKVVSQKVKLFRANEPFLSVFMWGINHTINELNHINIPVMLMPDDFKSFNKVRVDSHFFNKENMPSHFKVKEYCPVVFRHLRERFGIDDNDYMNSLTKQLHELDSPGRSGARMLLSHDRKYFIKTLVSEEVEQMHHVLKQYYPYIVEHHAQTLLTQYIGMYRITVNDIETYLIVMRNIFSPRLPIHKKYDLKGSTVDRNASDKEKTKGLPTYKDNDFVSDGVMIYIGVEEKEKLLTTLHRDVEFLSSLNLMDYSLIVGIHDRDLPSQYFDQLTQNDDEDDNDEDDENNTKDDFENGVDSGEDMEDTTYTPPESPNVIEQIFTGELDPKLELYAITSYEGAPKNEIYFMALIDILTHYGMKKRTAQAAKTVKHGTGAEISTVKPDQYAKRFLEFITKCIENDVHEDENTAL